MDAPSALASALQTFASEKQLNAVQPDQPERYDAALQAFRQVAWEYPDADAGLTAKLMEGFVSTSLPGGFLEMKAPLEEVVAAAPSSWQGAFAHLLLAQVYYNRGVGEAERDPPDVENSVSDCGVAAWHAQQAVDAISLVTDEAWRPLQLFGGLPPRDELPALAHLMLGLSLLDLGVLDEAIRELAYVVDASPGTNTAQIAERRLGAIGLSVSQKAPPGRPAPMVPLVVLREHPISREFTITWLPRQRQGVLERDGLRMVVCPGSDSVLINETSVRLAAPAQVRDGRLMLPEAFVNATTRAVPSPSREYSLQARALLFVE
ncbi:MAG: hypothetical protein ACE149_18250 [Armatimonadota bacterium]